MRGTKGGIAPPNLLFVPCHKSTTISFTVNFVVFMLNLQLSYNFRVKTPLPPTQGVLYPPMVQNDIMIDHKIDVSICFQCINYDQPLKLVLLFEFNLSNIQGLCSTNRVNICCSPSVYVLISK